MPGGSDARRGWGRLRRGTRSPDRRALTAEDLPVERLRVTCSCALDVSRALVRHVARLLGAERLGAGFGLSREAPDLQEALEKATDDELAYLILDGKTIESERVGGTKVSKKSREIDLWYSDKAHAFGGQRPGADGSARGAAGVLTPVPHRPTASRCTPTSAPTTGCCAACAVWASADSPCSSDAGKSCKTAEVGLSPMVQHPVGT